MPMLIQFTPAQMRRSSYFETIQVADFCIGQVDVLPMLTSPT